MDEPKPNVIPMDQLRAQMEPQDTEKIREGVEAVNAAVKEEVAEAVVSADKEEPTVHVGVAGEGKKPVELPTDYDKDLSDLESFKDLTFVDLSARRQSVLNNMRDLQQSKQAIDQVRAKAVSELGAKISEANILDIMPNGAQMTDFLGKYPELMADGQRLVDLIDAIIKEVPDDLKTSVHFLSDSMVQSCNLKLAKLEAADPGIFPNKALDIKRITNVRNAYLHREDMRPLINKLSYGQNVLAAIKEILAGSQKDMGKYLAILADIFKDKEMLKFRELIFRMVHDDPDYAEKVSKDEQVFDETVILLMTAWLAITYDKEVKTGKSSYVKTFIMNTYDYWSKDMTFDIHGGKAVYKMAVVTIHSIFRAAIVLRNESFKKAMTTYTAEYHRIMGIYTEATKVIFGDHHDAITDAECVDDSRICRIIPEDAFERIAREREELRKKQAEMDAGEFEEGDDGPWNEHEGFEAAAEAEGESESDDGDIDANSGSDKVPEESGDTPSDADSAPVPEVIPEKPDVDDDPLEHMAPTEPTTPPVRNPLAKPQTPMEPPKLPIADPPKEDPHEVVQEELAHGNDTPTLPKPRANLG